MLPELLTLPSYGLMMALALLLGWAITMSLGRRDRLPPGPLSTSYVLGAGLGLFGARLGWLLSRPGDVASGAELVAIRGDELAPFLGIMFGALVAGLHLTRRRVPVAAAYDVFAPAFAAGAVVERLGALLAGTGYGRVAPDLPWAIRFPAGSPPFVDHQRTLEGLLSAGAEQSLPVHPTQLYGLVLAGLTLGVALWLRKHRRFSGQVMLGTAIAHLAGRAFVEEWFRADAGAAMAGPFNSAQAGALTLIVSLGIVMWARGRLATQRPEAYRPWEGGRWSPREPGDGGRPSVAPSKPAAGGRTGGGTTKAKHKNKPKGSGASGHHKKKRRKK
ncbi:MAG: prolipoprotein diacylglyceryl transferase family protein [Nannocystaceae bacterium]